MHLTLTSLPREKAKFGSVLTVPNQPHHSDHCSCRMTLRSRDYCNSNAQNVQMCVSVVTASVALKAWGHVMGYADKGAHTGGDEATLKKLELAKALAHLGNKEYKDCARILTRIPLDIEYPEVISAEDIALIGCVTALASSPASDLKAALSSPPFANYLRLVPSAAELASSYLHSDYSCALERINALKQAMTLDINLTHHADKLTGMVTDRCIRSYASPYRAVKLERLKAVFGDVEGRVAEMIRDGKLAGHKIDQRAGTLIAVESGEDDAIKDVLKAGENFVTSCESSLMNVSLRKEGVVKGRGSSRSRGRYRGAGRRGVDVGDDFEGSDDGCDDVEGDDNAEMAWQASTSAMEM